MPYDHGHDDPRDKEFVICIVVAVIVWYSTVYCYLAIIIHMTTSLSRGSSWL
jgi:hypothetical protein